MFVPENRVGVFLMKMILFLSIIFMAPEVFAAQGGLTDVSSVHRWYDGRHILAGLVLLISAVGVTACWFLKSKKAEQNSTMEERQRFFQVLENTSDAVGFATPDRKSFYVNKAGRELLGMAPDMDVSEMTPEVIYPEDTYRIITNEVLPTIARDGIWSGQSQLKKCSGEIVPIWQVVMLHRKADGTPDFVSSIAHDMTEPRRAESALQASEEKFSKAFQVSPDSATISRTSDGQLMEVNEGFERVFGWSSAEAMGRSTKALGIYSDFADRKELVRRLKATGHVRKLEMNFIRKDGSRGVGLISAESIQLQGEDCMVTIVRDISDRKAAEAELRSSRNMLQQVLDSIPARVFWKDRECRFIGANKLCIEDAGFTGLDELVGHDDFEIGNSEEAERYRADDLEVMEGGKSKLSFEETKTFADGEVRWMRTSKVPLRDADGNVQGLLGVYEDITSRKTVEMAFEQSEQKLRLALDAASMGVWEWDLTTDRITVSDRVAEIYGVRPEEFSGTIEDYEKRIHPEDIAIVRKRILTVLKTPDSEYQVEHRLIRPDGSVHWVEARGQVDRDEAGEPRRLSGTVWDTTFRKTGEENLLKISQSVSGAHGEELHRQIVQTLASVTGADVAFLGHVGSDNSVLVTTFLEDGKFADSFRYDLENSPCINVVGRKICLFPSKVQEKFPKDEWLVQRGIQAYAGAPLLPSDNMPSGLLVALFKTPLSRPAEVESVLHILGSAAMADFERSAANAALQQANDDLEERVRDRTNELQRLVNLMAGREIRMAELKTELRELRKKTAADIRE